MNSISVDNTYKRVISTIEIPENIDRQLFVPKETDLSRFLSANRNNLLQ